MFRKIALALLILFALLNILPYLLPVQNKTIDNIELFSDSNFIKYEGLQIHYRFIEPETTNVKGNIIMVHGFAGSTFSWRYTADFFANNGYRVLLIDMPGFGFTEKGKKWNYSSSSKAELIKNLCHSLVPDTKWTIVGHSMGGGIAIYAAALFPQKFEKLVVVAGAYRDSSQGYFNSGLVKSVLKYPPLHRWTEVIGKTFIFHEERFENLLTSAYGRPATEEETVGYLLPFTLKNSASAIIKMMAYRKAEKTVSLSRDLTMPVLIVWGEDDTWVPLSFGEFLYEEIPNATFKIIKNSGHCPMETHADEFNRLVEYWLSGNN
jgi:2-hydroxy-6-oxonona-2,4-dienedioate hydrolase